MRCRHCEKILKHTFLDLGFAPPSNSYLTSKELSKPEVYYPLKIKVCEYCWLVQTEDYANAETLFTPEYAYFSSTSSGWLKHAKQYTNKIINLLNLNKDSFVIEVASNDGYLLKNFIAAGIPCLGIEPTSATAAASERIGVPVIKDFFSEELSSQLVKQNIKADLIIGNNVYAHVPNINAFTVALKKILKPNGTITLEFPHILRLIEGCQFDTVYHEHFSYLSLFTVKKIFEKVGLKIWDVEELTTHGGSLRIYGCHAEENRNVSLKLNQLLAMEFNFGLQEIKTYSKMQENVDRIKNDLLYFLVEKKLQNRKVVAYGAAAKGNTLLNYAGIKKDLIEFVVDAAKSKQGKYMPGSHIPILSPARLKKNIPEYILILPWNIAPEIINANRALKNLGVKFLTASPKLVEI